MMSRMDIHGDGLCENWRKKLFIMEKTVHIVRIVQTFRNSRSGVTKSLFCEDFLKQDGGDIIMMSMIFLCVNLCETFYPKQEKT